MNRDVFLTILSYGPHNDRIVRYLPKDMILIAGRMALGYKDVTLKECQLVLSDRKTFTIDDIIRADCVPLYKRYCETHKPVFLETMGIKITRYLAFDSSIDIYSYDLSNFFEIMIYDGTKEDIKRMFEKYSKTHKALFMDTIIKHGMVDLVEIAASYDIPRLQIQNIIFWTNNRVEITKELNKRNLLEYPKYGSDAYRRLSPKDKSLLSEVLCPDYENMHEDYSAPYPKTEKQTFMDYCKQDKLEEVQTMISQGFTDHLVNDTYIDTAQDYRRESIVEYLKTQGCRVWE